MIFWWSSMAYYSKKVRENRSHFRRVRKIAKSDY